MGPVAFIQNTVLAFPWPAGMRALLLHPAGPFTSNLYITS